MLQEPKEGNSKRRPAAQLGEGERHSLGPAAERCLRVLLHGFEA